MSSRVIKAKNSRVIKAKNFDVDRATLSPLQHVVNRNFVAPLRYHHADGVCDELVVQLPRASVQRSLYESNGKFFMDLTVCRHGVFHQLYDALLELCERLRQTESQLEACEVSNHLRKVHEDAYSIRVKCPRNGGNFATRAWCASGGECTIGQVPANDEVIALIAVEWIYATDKAINFNMLLREIKVVS